MSDTENAIIGAVIGNQSCIQEVVSIVSSSDFESVEAGTVFNAVVEMFKAEEVIDLVTVSSKIGVDPVYVSKCASVGVWSNVKQYAIDISRIAKEKRIKRGLSEAAEEKTSSRMLAKITDIYNAESGEGKKDPEIKNVLNRFKKHIKRNIARGSLGFCTGIAALESAMIYYVEGQIWTMGGYTSTGKTAMMVQMIVNIFSEDPNAKVCLISTEMTEEQMVGRMIANISGIYSQKIMSGNLNVSDEENYSKAYKRIETWDLKIHDDISELSAIESTVMSHSMRGGVDVVFVDYVQNCCVKGVSESYMEQKALASGLQQLAKRATSCIVCLSQVSNAVGRGMIDTFELKGAGEWAAVTDVGIMLKRGTASDNELLFSAPKNRHGTKPNVIFKFSENYSFLVETGERIR